MPETAVNTTGTDGAAATTHWLDADPEYAAVAKNPDDRQVVEKYKTKADQVKGHIELQRQFRTSFRMPETLDSLTEEERSKILTRVGKTIGAREKPEEYELARPKMPDGLGYDEEQEKALRTWAVKHHIPQAALAELHQDVYTRQVKSFEDDVKDHTTAYAAVKKAMVGKFGDAWEKEIGPGVIGMLTEYAKKSGLWTEKKDAQTDIVDGLLYTKDGQCTPLMAALSVMYKELHSAGSTNLGIPAGKGSDQINVKERWPNSASVMEG